MTVMEIALSAAALLQADDIEASIVAEEETDGDVKTLVKCVNLAVAELYGDFPPLVTEFVQAENGVIPFSAFAQTPSVVRGVEMRGKPVTFGFDSRGIRVASDGEYAVIYTAAPSDKNLDETVVVGAGVEAELIAYLTARNYCLITGRNDEATVWDARYNAEAENKRLRRRARLPERRFLG